MGGLKGSFVRWWDGKEVGAEIGGIVVSFCVSFSKGLGYLWECAKKCFFDTRGYRMSLTWYETISSVVGWRLAMLYNY